MLLAKGYTQGAKEMRDTLAAEFAKLGSGYFRGDECAALILRAPAPVFEERAVAQTP
jgi:hypothetical protein